MVAMGLVIGFALGALVCWLTVWLLLELCFVYLHVCSVSFALVASAVGGIARCVGPFA